MGKKSKEIAAGIITKNVMLASMGVTACLHGHYAF
jgi:hypothetical protein